MGETADDMTYQTIPYELVSLGARIDGALAVSMAKALPSRLVFELHDDMCGTYALILYRNIRVAKEALEEKGYHLVRSPFQRKY